MITSVTKHEQINAVMTETITTGMNHLAGRAEELAASVDRYLEANLSSIQNHYAQQLAAITNDYGADLARIQNQHE